MSWHRMLAVVVYTFISVTHSACSDSAKEASGKDREKPISTTKPAAGKFNKTQTVQLSCDDQRGSGCVATYYTLNGEDPDTSSKKFTDPFTIDKTTTVKYFSVDAEGNKEAVKTAVFTFDQVAPEVVSSDPPDSGGNVPLNGAEIRVTFSEDMNEASLNSSTFSVENELGKTSWSVEYNSESKTVIFKAEESLDAGNRYTVSLSSGVLDAAGNALSPHKFQFTAASEAWVAKNSGLVKLSSANEELVRIDTINCLPIGSKVTLAVDNISKALWVSDYENNRVLKLDDEGKLLAYTSIIGPKGMLVDPRDGSVWLTSGADTKITETTTPYTKYLVKLVKLTSLGTLWLETKEVESNAYGREDEQKQIEPKMINPQDGSVWLFEEDYRENFYTDGQLRIRGKDSKLANFDYRGASGSNINKFFPGLINLGPSDTILENGNFGFWAGTYADRITLFDNDGNVITTSEPLKQYTDKYSTSVVSTSVVKAGNSVWALVDGETSNAIAKYSAEGKVLVNEAVSFAENETIEADSVDGGVWLSHSEGLSRYDGKGKVVWNDLSEPVNAIAVYQSYGKQIHVSAEGSEDGDGSAAKPLQFIQTAVDIAKEGDTIQIASGSYNENVVSKKSLRLIGENANNTTITGDGLGHVVAFSNVRYAHIEGLTITNGGIKNDGAGIFCTDCTDLTIRNNIVVKNGKATYIDPYSYKYGAIYVFGDDGIYFDETAGYLRYPQMLDISYPRTLVYQNLVIDNLATGIANEGTQAVIRNNIVAHNSYNGIFSFGEPTTEINNNSISGNGVSGIFLLQSGKLVGNISVNNGNSNDPDGRAGGILFDHPFPYSAGDSPDFRYQAIDHALSYNNVFNNLVQDYTAIVYPDPYGVSYLIPPGLEGEGALSFDPLFNDPVNTDFKLKLGSPAIDAGPPNENPDATAECGSPDRRNDMGAYGGLWGDW